MIKVTGAIVVNDNPDAFLEYRNPTIDIVGEIRVNPNNNNVNILTVLTGMDDSTAEQRFQASFTDIANQAPDTKSLAANFGHFCALQIAAQLQALNPTAVIVVDPAPTPDPTPVPDQPAPTPDPAPVPDQPTPTPDPTPVPDQPTPTPDPTPDPAPIPPTPNSAPQPPNGN